MLGASFLSIRAKIRWSLLGAALVAAASPHCFSAEPRNEQAVTAEKAVRSTAASFAEAFDRGDAKAVAALWTAEGSLVDEAGQLVKGRGAIEAKYADFFKQHPGAKIRVTVRSIEFPAPGVAVEDGVAELASPQGGSQSASRYTVVHTLAGGKWLMASVREAASEPATGSAGLEALSGLIGQWVARAQRCHISIRLSLDLRPAVHPARLHHARARQSDRHGRADHRLRPALGADSQLVVRFERWPWRWNLAGHGRRLADRIARGARRRSAHDVGRPSYSSGRRARHRRLAIGQPAGRRPRASRYRRDRLRPPAPTAKDGQGRDALGHP